MSSITASFIQACQNGNLAQVQELWAQGASINANAGGGFTAMHLAAAKGHAAVVAFLAAHGADLEAKETASSMTPLILTAFQTDTEESQLEKVTRVLLKQKASFKATDRYGNTALSLSIRYFHPLVTKTLVEWGARPSQQDLVIAREKAAIPGIQARGFDQTVLALLENPTRQSATRKVRSTIEKVRSPTEELHVAGEERYQIFGGTNEMANIPEGTVWICPTKCLRVGENGITQLHMAVIQRDLNTARRLLLENGEQVNVQESDGYTPLHMAASRADTKMIQLLLSFGANVNANEAQQSSEAYRRGDKMITPLHCVGTASTTASSEADYRLRKQAVRVLLEAGAEAKAKTTQGYTPREVLQLRRNPSRKNLSLLQQAEDGKFIKNHGCMLM